MVPAPIRFLSRAAWSALVAGLILFLGACFPEPAVWLEPLPSPSPAGYISPDEIFEVYFTAPASDGFRGGPDSHLAEDIDQAQFLVEAALYDLNLWSIRNALIRAHQRGVEVRLVMEGDSRDRREVQELIEAGIPVVFDSSEGLMHHKYLILDRQAVWTGSMNLTVNGAYRHLNNLIRIQSTLMAENYAAEFEEMYRDGFFGEVTLDNTPHPRINLNGIQIETLFSPDDHPEDRILELILSADQSIEFLFYSFTSDRIAEALVHQAGQGVQVRGVVDAYQDRAGIGGEYSFLAESGLPVYLDVHPEKMHHKVILVDREILLTGSYNLTRSAGTVNDENLLIISSPALAGIYLSEFEWIYGAAETAD